MAPKIVAGLLAGLMIIGAETPALAHRQSTGSPGPDGAIVIPNLSHGQMGVIAANKAAILSLAERQFPTDPVMRRLQGFIDLQNFACLWGLMPGTVRDEASPFNECAHADLAATRALLLHLQAMPGDRTAVRSLIAKIQTEMLLNRTALVICQYGDEPFNTAEIISPHWADIPSHPPTSATLGGGLFVLFGGTWFALRRRSSHSDEAACSRVRPSRGLEQAEHADTGDGREPQANLPEGGEA